MFTPTLRCECAQPSLIDTMRKWSIAHSMIHDLFPQNERYITQSHFQVISRLR